MLSHSSCLPGSLNRPDQGHINTIPIFTAFAGVLLCLCEYLWFVAVACLLCVCVCVVYFYTFAFLLQFWCLSVVPRPQVGGTTAHAPILQMDFLLPNPPLTVAFSYCSAP